MPLSIPSESVTAKRLRFDTEITSTISFEVHVGIDFAEVGLYQVVYLKQCEHALVLLMREQIAGFCQPHGVDTVGCEYLYCQI